MINAYCNDTVTLTTRTPGSFGEITETTATVKAFVQRKTKVIKTESGEDALSTGFVLLPIDLTVTLESLITFDGVSRRVLALETLRHFSAVYRKAWVA